MTGVSETEDDLYQQGSNRNRLLGYRLRQRMGGTIKQWCVLERLSDLETDAQTQDKGEGA